MKERKLKNIYRIILVMVFLISMISIINASGSSYSNNYANRIRNVELKLNISQEIGIIRPDFYGVNEQNGYFTTSGKIDRNRDGIIETNSDYEWHRNLLEESNINNVRIWIFLDHISISESAFDLNSPTSREYPFGNINMIKEEIAYLNSTGKKVLIRTSGMPVWLQNRSSNYCNSKAYNTCPSKNYTKFGIMMANLIGNITENYTYKNIELEVYNEPYSREFFLNNLPADHIIKAKEYIKLYNETYRAVKSRYPDISIGGPAGFRAHNNLMKTFLSNMTTNMDFVSIHPYAYNSYISTNQLYKDIESLLKECAKYNANCSRIIASEWGVSGEYVKDDLWGREIAYGYISILNTYPEIVSLNLQEWSARSNYISGNEKFEIVMEPLLKTIIRPAYSVTKDFATYQKTKNIVFNSTSNDANIKLTSSKDNNSIYISILNMGKNANVSLSINLYNNLIVRDLKSNKTYNLTEGKANLSLISSSSIRHFIIENYSTNN